MKTRITILAVTAAMLLGAAVTLRDADTAQAAPKPAPIEQMLGSTWS